MILLARRSGTWTAPLIDSADDHWLAWTEVLAEEGYALTRENFTAMFGRRNDDISITTCPAVRWKKWTSSAKKRNAVPGYRTPQTAPSSYRARARGWNVWPPLMAAGHRTAAPRANAEARGGVAGIGPPFRRHHRGGRCHDRQARSDGLSDGRGAFRRVSCQCDCAGRRAPRIEGARRAGMKSVGVCTLHPTLAADLRILSFEEVAGRRTRRTAHPQIARMNSDSA